ncbi:MAG TPA: DUF4097 family beta strand repeat-containing protein [Verrucomicrobiae bacterium]
MKKTFCCGMGFLLGAFAFVVSSNAEPRYEENLDKTFAVSPGGQLVISADMGPIHVVAGPSDKLEIHVMRRVDGGTQAEAADLFSRHEVSFSQEGNTVTVKARNKNHGFWGRNSTQRGLNVTYEVVAPRQFNMDLATAGGDISLDDLEGKLAAHTTSGSIHAGKITGSLAAKDAGGDIVIKAVSQDAKAETTSGSIELDKVGGKIEASDAGGEIHLGNVAGTINAHTTSASISIGSAGGDVNAGNAGGDIHIDNADGNVAVQTTSASIRIGAANGETVKAENRGGGIEILHASGAVQAETTSASISIGSALGNIDAKDAGGDIKIEKADGNVAVQTTSGSIRLGTVKGERIKAEDRGGDIAVLHANGAVDADTTSGSIKIDFAAGSVKAGDAGGDIKIDIAGKDVDAHTTSGTIHIGSAQGRIEARNAGGDVKIANASSAVNVETTSGTIDVSFSTPPKEDCRLVVMGGNINASVPPSSSLDIDEQALGGAAKSDLPLSESNAGANTLRGLLNAGGPKLTLHCTSGDIHLKSSSPLKEADAAH